MRKLVVFLILFGVWLVFSGHFDALHLGLGLACSGLVAAFSTELLLPKPLPSGAAVIAWRMLRYLPWLLWEIVLANLHVVYLVCRPGQLRPQVVRFKTGLKSDMAKVTLGNSITLTPGTVTLDIDGNDFTVHAVSDHAARSLHRGEMERRVGHTFLESSDRGEGSSVPGERTHD